MMSDVDPLRLDLDEIDRGDRTPDGCVAQRTEPDDVKLSGLAEDAMPPVLAEADDLDDDLEETWLDSYSEISGPALWLEWMAGILGANRRSRREGEMYPQAKSPLAGAISINGG
jgi:hypothetical protein